MEHKQPKQTRGKALATPQDAAFASNLKQYRERAGLSLGELARRISRTSGVSWQASTIFKIENGRKVSIGEANLIALALDVPLSDLVDERSAKTPEYFKSMLWDRREQIAEALAAVCEALTALKTAEDTYARNVLSIANPELVAALAEHKGQENYDELRSMLLEAREVMRLDLASQLWLTIWGENENREAVQQIADHSDLGYPELNPDGKLFPKAELAFAEAVQRFVNETDLGG